MEQLAMQIRHAEREPRILIGSEIIWLNEFQPNLSSVSSNM